MVKSDRGNSPWEMSTVATLSPRRHMLVVDDEPGMRQMLEGTFTDRGFDVTTASNGSKAIEVINQRAFDVIITDLKMPERDGLAVLRSARASNFDSPVIMITAYGTIDTAVEAMRLGARDFIAKPFKLAEIELKVDKIIGEKPIREYKESTALAPSSERPIVGYSKESKQLLKMIQKIGPSRSSVLITGPSGTG